jgi:RHS repeat-associated protein
MPSRPRTKPSSILPLLAAAQLSCGGVTSDDTAGDAGEGDPGTVPMAIARPNIAPPPIAASSSAGRIPGSGSVTPDGAYSYVIPIDVPAGRAGMQPELALSYSSRAGNGIVGVGWSVSGPSMIHRCEAIVASGGVRRRVDPVNGTTFCLDGQRLVLVSGTANTAGAEYRTEIDTFTRVTVLTVSGNQPATWRAEYADKRIARFAWDTDQPLRRRVRDATGAQVSSEQARLVWPMTQLADRNGNAVEWSFDNLHSGVVGADAVMVPGSVKYTTCTIAPCNYVSGNRRVVFGYEDRPAADVLVTYENGVVQRTTRRLSTVTVQIQNASTWVAQRTYRLTYGPSEVSSRSLLRRLDLCDGAGACVEGSVFRYSGSANDGYRVLQTNPLGGMQEHTDFLSNHPGMEIVAYDVNGDGNDDVVLDDWSQPGTGPGGAMPAGASRTRRVILANGTGFFDERAPVQVFGPCDRGHHATSIPVDLDANGKMELVLECADSGVATSTYRVLVWDQTFKTLAERALPGLNGRAMPGWLPPDGTVAVAAEGMLKFGDLDADGLPELFAGTTAGTQTWSVQKGTVADPGGGIPHVAWGAAQTTALPSIGPPDGTSTVRLVGQVTTILDQDLDGHNELTLLDWGASARSYSWVEFPSIVYGLYDGLNNVQTQPAPITHPAAPAMGTAIFGSFGYSPDGLWYFADINGDGLKDVIHNRIDAAGAFTWYQRFNTGTGYLAPTQITGAAGTALQTSPSDWKFAGAQFIAKGIDNGLRIADMNGDNRDDLVLLDPPGGGAAHWSGHVGQTGPARILFSTGDGFAAPIALPGYPAGQVRLSEGTLPGGNPVWRMSTIADVDGNGLGDLVELVGDGSNKRRLSAISRNLIGGIDLLTDVAIAASTSGTTTSVALQHVDYDSLSGGLRYPDRGATAHPDLESGGTFPLAAASRGIVVERYVAHDGNGGPRELRTRYSYSGGKADLTGRGFLGFAIVNATDEATGLRTVSTYDLSPVVSGAYRFYPRRGRASSVSTVADLATHDASLADATGAVNVPVTRWTPTYAAGVPLRMTSERVEELDDTGANPSSIVTESQYDDHGNAATVTTTTTDRTLLGTSSPPRVYTRTVSTSHYIDDATWRTGDPRKIVDTRTTDSGANSYQLPTAAGATSTATNELWYDARYNLVTAIREPNVTNPVDSALQYTEYVRDAAGLVTALRTHVPTGNACTSNASCAANQLCDRPAASSPKQCFARRDDHTYIYDTTGTFPESDTNAVGHQTWTLYDPARLWPYLVRDPNGVKTTITRDGFGRPVSEADDTGTQTSISYVAMDHLVTIKTSAAAGGTRSTFYDRLGRQELETWSTFDGKSGVELRTYDALGNEATRTYAGAASSEAAIAASRTTALQAHATNNPLLLSSARFDVRGRRVSEQRGATESIGYTYPAPFGTVDAVDANGQHTITVNDVLGRPLRLTQASASGTTYATNYRYGPTGELTSLKNEGGVVERFTYDRLGRRTEWTSGTDTSTTTTQRELLTFDSYDRATVVRRDGVDVTYTYDAIDRILTRTSGTESQTYGWDPANGVGRAANATTNSDAGHELRFTYNALGQLTNRRELFAGGATSLSFGYGYDAFGRLATMRYPEGLGSGDVSATPHTMKVGPTVRYNYQNGQVASITEEVSGSPVLWQVTKRHVLGMVTEAKYGPALTSTLTYDNNTLRPKTQSLAGVTSGPVPNQVFAYDAAGQLVQRTSSDRIESFTYDGSRGFLARYRRRNGANTSTIIDATFAYSAQGLSGVDTTASTGSPDWSIDDESYTFATDATKRDYRLLTHTIGATPTRSYVYDTAGRVREVKEGTTVKRRYDWSSFNLPTQVQHFGPNLTRTFGYDAYGARVKKRQDASNEVLYAGALYEARNLAIGERASIFRLETELGPVIELAHYWETTIRDLRNFITDEQGSIAYRVNGTASAQLGSFPFGKRQGGSPAQNFAALGYTGHRMDEDIGLINMNGRVYDITTRRFLTRDPVVDRPFATFGTQAYTYVGNNPTGFVDPTGYASSVYQGGVDPNEARNLRGDELAAMAAAAQQRAAAQAADTDCPADDCPEEENEVHNPIPRLPTGTMVFMGGALQRWMEAHRHEAGAAGAIMMLNAATRLGYDAADRARVRAALGFINTAGPGDLPAVLKAAKDASSGRNAGRAATQEMLNPGARVLSRGIQAANPPRDFQSVLTAKMQRGNAGKPINNPVELAKSIATSAGKTNKTVNRVSAATGAVGTALAAFNLVRSAQAVWNAPEGTRMDVAKTEVGSFVMGLQAAAEYTVSIPISFMPADVRQMFTSPGDVPSM